MPLISAFLGEDHDRCDQLFVEAERLAASGDSAAAGAAHEAFTRAMTRHFSMEEEAAFPAFEQATGQASGPTSVMRHEHIQMRDLFDTMAAALKQDDGDDFLAASETLLVLMQQHNAKEEQILYPMMDRMLRDSEPLIARMEGVAHGDRGA